MNEKNKVLKAKARFSFDKRIIVDNCPFCHQKHVHGSPVGEGQRTADCFRGEYILDFSEEEEVSDGSVQ